METKVLILEEKNGWALFNAFDGNLIVEDLSSVDECLKLCDERGFKAPYRGESGAFFHDMDGEALYRIDASKTGGLELEYSDGMACLDFEICQTCKGPAFGRSEDGHNCYFCPECDREMDCVPPPEWIGEAD